MGLISTISPSMSSTRSSCAKRPSSAIWWYSSTEISRFGFWIAIGGASVRSFYPSLPLPLVTGKHNTGSRNKTTSGHHSDLLRGGLLDGTEQLRHCKHRIRERLGGDDIVPAE